MKKTTAGLIFSAGLLAGGPLGAVLNAADTAVYDEHPHAAITRQQAAAVVAHVSKLAGSTELPGYVVRACVKLEGSEWVARLSRRLPEGTKILKD